MNHSINTFTTRLSVRSSTPIGTTPRSSTPHEASRCQNDWQNFNSGISRSFLGCTGSSSMIVGSGAPSFSISVISVLSLELVGLECIIARQGEKNESKAKGYIEQVQVIMQSCSILIILPLRSSHCDTHAHPTISRGILAFGALILSDEFFKISFFNSSTRDSRRDRALVRNLGVGEGRVAGNRTKDMNTHSYQVVTSMPRALRSRGPICSSADSYARVVSNESLGPSKPMVKVLVRQIVKYSNLNLRADNTVVYPEANSTTAEFSTTFCPRAAASSATIPLIA